MPRNAGARAATFSQEQRQVLADSDLLRAMPPAKLEQLLPHLTLTRVGTGHAVVAEGDTSRELYLLLDGECQIERGGMTIGRLEAGDHFGELGLVTHEPRAATIMALIPVALAVLSSEAYSEISQTQPELALQLATAIIRTLRRELTNITDSLGVLLSDRHLPRRAEITVRLMGTPKRVGTGTLVKFVLPERHENSLVVAALAYRKAISLNTQLTADCDIEPLPISHFEGQRIYGNSVCALLLEAAHQQHPAVDLTLGPSVGFARIVRLKDHNGHTTTEIAQALEATMTRLVSESRPFREEYWSVDEAIRLFQRQGWEDSCELLQTWRDRTVQLRSCGSLYLLSFGPLLPDTSQIRGFRLMPHDGVLLLFYGDPETPHAAAPALNTAGEHELLTLERARIAGRDHEQWLNALGVSSVGAFNRYCIRGEVTRLIHVAEGFQEKRIAAIADTIASDNTLRVICVAGPSSAGKTTFIKRLTTQLQINGINPLGLSLDDYYVDREKTVRDEHGEYDFEAVEALDLDLLHRDLAALRAGESVRLARYDFTTGTSHPGSGGEVHLAANNVLLIEGIHGLNPRVLNDSFPREHVYRIFVNPMTTLPFDAFNRLNTSDLRLLRRIVRDRRHRAISAADNIARWASVRRGEQRHIFPFLAQANMIFDSALVYEISVVKVYADRYLLEVPSTHPSYTTAYRLRQLIERYVTIYPDHVPSTSILREFIGGSGFDY